MTNLITTGPADARAHLVLAHGAGAPMTSPFLEEMAKLLAERAVRVTRFEFAYMAARRTSGTHKPPPKMEALASEYAALIAREGKPHHSLVIGGKSMGGRVASLIADDGYDRGLISGLVCLGYPFHPPKKPEALRTAHLGPLRCPTLIVQGERDPFGTREDVAGYALSRAIDICWAIDGDHDLKPRVRSDVTHDINLAAAADAIAEFCNELPKQDYTR